MALSSFSSGMCKKVRLGGHLFANLGPPDSNPSRQGCGVQQREHDQPLDRRYNDAHDVIEHHDISPREAVQTPTHSINATSAFVQIKINEPCGDCDMGAHNWVSSFCSLMWIARGRPGRSLRCASASTNTASTPVARTLRICACDRSLAPVPRNPHRKKERPK